MSWINVTLVCLAIIFILTVIGLFSPYFRENWLQHFGLIGLGITSISAIFRVSAMEWVSQEMAIFVVSLTLFALGTAHKVWKYRENNQARQPHVPVDM